MLAYNMGLLRNNGLHTCILNRESTEGDSWPPTEVVVLLV